MYEPADPDGVDKIRLWQMLSKSHAVDQQRSSTGASRRARARDRPLALRSGDRMPVLARAREARSTSIRSTDVKALRRSRQVRLLRGRVAARRPGAPLGAEGVRRQRRSTCSRPAAAPACRSRASTSTTSASTTRTSARRCPTTRFPKGADWLHGRAERPAPAAPGRRAPGAASRRHLLHGRSRSALGHQADQGAARWTRWRPTSSTSSTRR